MLLLCLRAPNPLTPTSCLGISVSGQPLPSPHTPTTALLIKGLPLSWVLGHGRPCPLVGRPSVALSNQTPCLRNDLSTNCSPSDYPLRACTGACLSTSGQSRCSVQTCVCTGCVQAPRPQPRHLHVRIPPPSPSSPPQGTCHPRPTTSSLHTRSRDLGRWGHPISSLVSLLVSHFLSLPVSVPFCVARSPRSCVCLSPWFSLPVFGAVSLARPLSPPPSLPLPLLLALLLRSEAARPGRSSEASEVRPGVHPVHCLSRDGFPRPRGQPLLQLPVSRGLAQRADEGAPVADLQARLGWAPRKQVSPRSRPATHSLEHPRVPGSGWAGARGREWQGRGLQRGERHSRTREQQRAPEASSHHAPPRSKLPPAPDQAQVPAVPTRSCLPAPSRPGLPGCASRCLLRPLPRPLPRPSRSQFLLVKSLL